MMNVPQTSFLSFLSTALLHFPNRRGDKQNESVSI